VALDNTQVTTEGVKKLNGLSKCMIGWQAIPSTKRFWLGEALTM
jgi:hypothetical protein